MQGKVDFCVDKAGLPVGCADSGLTSGEQNEEDASLTSRAQNKEGGFNRTYVNEDGKIRRHERPREINNRNRFTATSTMRSITANHRSSVKKEGVTR